MKVRPLRITFAMLESFSKIELSGNVMRNRAISDEKNQEVKSISLPNIRATALSKPITWNNFRLIEKRKYNLDQPKSALPDLTYNLFFTYSKSHIKLL